MNRSLAILLGVLALGAVMFAGSYWTGHYAGLKCCSNPADDLSWLHDEFHLSNAELSHIRQLHENYLPQCMAMCARIAEKKVELASALDSDTNLTGAAQEKLNELAALRAQCQGQMLQHFIAVSRAMPPAAGRRYLAEMKSLTLDLHENIEQSMSDATRHEPHHP